MDLPDEYPKPMKLISQAARVISAAGIFPSCAVVAAGSMAAFFSWTLTISEKSLNSYIFFNNLAVQERRLLIFFLGIGAVLFYILWLLLARGLRRRFGSSAGSLKKTAVFFSPAILLGFWPFLAVQAIEVYHTLPVFFLTAGFLLVTFFLFNVFTRQYRLSGSFFSRSTDGGNRLSFQLLILFTLVYAVFFVAFTLGRHYSFHSYAFDLGWQHQAMYSLLQTGNPRITLWVDLNHLGNHFQPLYYLLAPLYALRQDASTLLVLQTLFLASAAFPIYLIGRKRTGNPWTALTIAVVYLLYPPLHGLNNFDFHGLALLIPFASFLLYGLESRNYRVFWIFFILALITREDTAVSLSGVGLYLLLDRQRRKLGFLVLFICAGYFFLVMKIMTALDGSADLKNYMALTVPGQQNFRGVITTLFTNPQFVFSHIFLNTAKLEYLIQILLPVAFIVLFAGKNIVLLVPGLAIILLSNTFFNYSIACPYSAHLIPQIFFLTACGIQKIRNKWGGARIRAVVLTLLVAGMLMNFEFGLFFSKRFPGFLRPTDHQRTVYSFFDQIPGDASVTATRRLVPHLANRNEIHLYQAPHPDTDYILLDLMLPEPAIDTHEHWYQAVDPDHLRIRGYVTSRLLSGDYGVIRYEDGFILLKRGYDVSANESILREIRSFSEAERPTIIDYYNDPAGNVNPPEYSQSDLLMTLLKGSPRDTVILAANGDVAGNLSYTLKIFLLRRGSEIHTLDIWGSYIAVLNRGMVILELIDNDGPVEVQSSGSPVLKALFHDRELSVYSSGSKLDGSSSIQISGQEYAMEGRGMTVLVIDSLGRVREQAVYATGR
jgi:uncharacterized membrane protein